MLPPHSSPRETCIYEFFISHNNTQKTWVRRLAAELKLRNIRYFLDEECIGLGEDIVNAIGVGLKSSRHVLLILSAQSVASRWVELEWATSLYDDPDAAAKRLIPIRVDECEIPYLLRRLNYLDARSMDIQAVAQKLLTVLNETVSAQPKATERLPHALVEVSTVLGFGSKQYVTRRSDTELRRVLAGHGAAVLFGPRKIGKTSMMRKAWGESVLRGNATIFMDLQGFDLKHCDSFFLDMAHCIADECGVEFREASGHSVVLQLQRLVRSICRDTPMVLFIDEIDALAHIDDLSRATGTLRSLLGHPASAGRLAFVCAGLLPPHRWRDPDPMVSPWWNMLQMIRVDAFSNGEVESFVNQLGISAGMTQVADIFRLTGGEPWLVAQIARSIAENEWDDELTHPQRWRRWKLAQTFDTAKYLLKDDLPRCLKAIARGERILSAVERESLWLAGITRDAFEDPPRPLSALLLESIKDQIGHISQKSGLGE